jgi:hypothetical protein
VSRTALRGHRSISSALRAASASRRAALVEIEPGHYQDTLTIRGEVELAVTGGPGSVVVSQSQGSVVDALGTVRLDGLVLVGRGGDTVCCHGGTLTIEHAQIQGHSGVSVHARAGASVTLRDSVIANGRTLFAGSTGLVERCQFIDAADNALAVIESANVWIRDSSISHSRIHGIRVSGARARITGCELTGTGNSAVMADTRAEVTVADCRITAVHSTGISFIEQSRGSVKDTRVTDAEHGIAVLSGADPLVRRCVFTACRDTGINVHTQGLGRFEECEVVRAGNVAVFSTTDGSPDVRGCRISSGNVGVAVVNARGRFSQLEVDDLTGAALRLWDGAVAEFSHVQVARCPTGLDARGDAGTKGELADVSFREFSVAAVTVLGQSRVTLRNCSAEHGPVGFGVGDKAQLFGYDCRIEDVEVGGVVAYDNAFLTAKRLTVAGSGGFGLAGQGSAHLDVTNSEFADTTAAGVALGDSCAGRLEDCSVTGTRGVGVVDNGRVQLISLRSSLPVTERTPEPAPYLPAPIVNNFYGPVFQAAAEGLQLAWNNATVSQEQTARPSSGVDVGVHHHAGDRMIHPRLTVDGRTCITDSGGSVSDDINQRSSETGMPPASTTINNGPVFHGDASGAQLAWNSANVAQNQTRNEQIAPGFEEIARVVAGLLRQLGDFDLSDDDAQDVTDDGNIVLAEVVKPQPDPGVIRRAVKAIKGALAPIATGMISGTSSGATELAKQYIQSLG